MIFEKEIFSTKIVIAISDIRDGEMSSSAGIHNLDRFLSQNSMSSLYSGMSQDHGILLSHAVGEQVMGDSVWTEASSRCLVIKTADCLPLVLYDPLQKILIVQHCGYRGILKGIVDVGIDFLRKHNSEFQNVYAFLGPCICEECYAVDSARYEHFKNAFPESVYEKKDQYHINIRDAVYRKLITNGIAASNVQQLERCTKEDERYFSYRKGNKTERFVTVAEMRYV